MRSYTFADILLTAVILLITFAILYLVDRSRKESARKKDRKYNRPTDKHTQQ